VFERLRAVLGGVRVHRALVLTLLELACVCAGARGTETVAEITELLSWPILSATVSAEAVLVSPDPQEELTNCELWRGQAGESPCVFGLLPVGSSSDPGISFAVIETDPPTLIMDLDNDEVLSPDEVICCELRQRIGPRSYTWYPMVHVEYRDGDELTSSPTTIQFTALYSYSLDSLRYAYGPFCQKVGHVNLDTGTYRVSVTTLSPELNYSDLSQLIVCIDTDGDGVLDALPGSHEVYSFGNSVQVGTTEYRIASVSADGTRLALVPAGDAPARLPIERDMPAPDFETTDLFGEELRSSELRGGVVVLLFFPQLAPPTCETCAEIASSAFYSRLESVLYDLEPISDGVAVVVVVAEGISFEALSLLPTGIVRYVHDTAINDLYRRAYGAIVVDQAGIIRALDEAWATFACGRPTGSYKILRPSEIAAVVTRLLEQDQ